ncbi:hypothetical protein L1887_31662 [Cichorium endivia]|nr:hypothetical protein L1887_31662 [Cichorium endivia]
MTINHCDASPSSYVDKCNGSVAGCPTLLEEDDEFLMDTEEHRRILAETKKMTLAGLDRNSPACGTHCQGDSNYDAGHRQCGKTNYCQR